MTDLKKAALELAESGIAVFPLGADKKPRTTHGFKDASTDEKQINEWNWNSGGAIGAAIPEGYFVVDVDPRHGGDQTIKALISAGLRFPSTKVVKTKGGGTHRFYKLPEEYSTRSLKGTLGPGVDIKVGGKGYTVVPPSEGYEIQFDLPEATAPEWMLDELLKPEVNLAEFAASDPKFMPFEKGTGYGLAAMELELKELANAPEGTRNNALNKAAFSLAQLVAGGELKESTARPNLETIAAGIGLEDREIEQTLNSGWEAGLQEPRQAPPKESPGQEVGSESLETQLAGEVAAPTSTFDEFDAEENLWTDYTSMEFHPPEYYLFPLVPKSAYLLVYGPTEASKSMVFMALAAQGSHQGLRTSMYSLENPVVIDVDRLKRWNANPENLRISHQILDLNDPRQLEDMIRREKAWGVDWIVLDTYSHAFNFRSDDGNAKAIHFSKIIRHILKEVDCTVIVVDHTGYQAHGEPRDASAKRQAVDMSIKMERPAGYEWRPNQPSVFICENTKSARFGNPFRIVGRIIDKPDRGLDLAWDGESHLEWRLGASTSN